jgi:vacuolar-type H+-ATPase catalytic subunit A/Vma1
LGISAAKMYEAVEVGEERLVGGVNKLIGHGREFKVGLSVVTSDI